MAQMDHEEFQTQIKALKELEDVFFYQSVESGKARAELREILETTSGDRACCACLDRSSDTVLFPCAHLVCCCRCAALLVDCLVCRKRILHKLPVYMP